MSKQIYIITEYDLISTKIVPNNYYVCTDSRRIYRDTNNNTRVAILATMIDSEIDRVYNTKVTNGNLYYVWETNVLWLYNTGWLVIAGENNSSSGYYYNNGSILSVDDSNKVIDNNGLLKDGSVVVRDLNRVIKGRSYIDGQNNNLIISSYLGGGIQILPNDTVDAMGSLVINPRTLYISKYINNITGEQFTSNEYINIEQVLNNDNVIDLYDIYQTLKNIRKCPPEINEDNYLTHVEVLRRLEDIYIDISNYDQIDILDTYEDGYAMYNGQWNTTDDMYINKRYPLTVSELQLMDCTEDTDITIVYNLLKESKLVDKDSDISNYTNEEILEALLHFKGTVYSEEVPRYKVWHEGNLDPTDLIIDSNRVLTLLQLLPEPLDLNVRYLSGLTSDDFSLKNHKHITSDITDFIPTIKGMMQSKLSQDYGDFGIYIFYNSVTDKFDFIARTFRITLSGGVSGNIDIIGLNDAQANITVLPDNHIHNIVKYENDEYLWNDDYITIKNYTDYITSSKIDKTEAVTTSTPNKILYLDENGELPANITGNSITSNEALKLSNEVIISLSSGVTGSASFDGSENIDMEVVVDPSKHSHDDRYILLNSIGVTIPPLDSNRIITESYLPDSILDCLQYQGTFNPLSEDINNLTIRKGYYWIISNDGVVNSKVVYTDDWIVYNGNDWNHITNKIFITSVNGYIGDINLTTNDLNAINDSYIDYYRAINSASGFEVYEQYYIDNGISIPTKPSSAIEYPIELKNYTIETDLDTSYYCIWLDDVLIYLIDPILNETIPQGKIVITDSSNYSNINVRKSIEAEKLSEVFKITSTIDSDVSIDDVNNSTDGTNNIVLKMKLSSEVVNNLSSTSSNYGVYIDLITNGL